MGQSELYQHLKLQKRDWKTTREIINDTDLSKTSIVKSAWVLKGRGLIEIKKRKVTVNNIVVNSNIYRVKKCSKKF